MPFIRRQDIDPELLAVHDREHKATLRKGLLNPGLSAEQRQRIREELALVGMPRIYSKDRPPRPGAISTRQQTH